MEDAGQLAYLRASVRECGFDKKVRANPARCGTLDRSAYCRVRISARDPREIILLEIPFSINDGSSISNTSGRSGKGLRNINQSKHETVVIWRMCSNGLGSLRD